MNGRIFLAAGLSAALLGCGHKSAPPTAPPLPAATVRAETVERQTRVATEEVVGTVRARLRSVIEAKVSGRIEQLPVVPGQPVNTGALLVTIDAREVQARYDQAVAVRQQAENDLKRLTTLFAQQILSQAEFDNALARSRVAAAGVIEAEAMLGYTKVTAPFAGVITRKHADVGDLATPGKPLLEMEDSTVLRLEADVPEAVVGRLKLGDPCPVRVAALEPELAGVVTEIAPAADPSSRTFLVKLDLPPVAGLRAGQFGRMAMPVGETTALRVAATAVVQRGQMEMVFVVHAGKAQLRLVKTGKRIGAAIELVSGVEANETVVVENAAGLVDGQPLILQP